MEGEDVGSSITFAAEGEILAKQGEFAKALVSFSKALEINPSDKNCLVARSKCHLQLGDSHAALKDAEAALEEDKDFIRGIYQKAAALYDMGDFEYALVFFHRGNKLRPELDEFRLGIQKAREAIDNSIGNQNACKLDNINTNEKKEKGFANRGASATGAGGAARPHASSAKHQEQPASDKTIKQLLGELYADKEYLEKLTNDADFISANGEIGSLVSSGLNYLESRAEFWRQQKPLYARTQEHMKRRTRVGSKDNYIEQSFEQIHKALDENNVEHAQKLCKQFLRKIGELTMSMVDKMRLNARVQNAQGTAHMMLGNFTDALKCHNKDLAIAEEQNDDLSRSRAYGSLGRVMCMKSDFESAIDMWTKAREVTTTHLELAWLNHDIGRCHFELERYEQAIACGTDAIECANNARDDRYVLDASILLGRSHSMLLNHDKAIIFLERALALANRIAPNEAPEVEQWITEAKDSMAQQDATADNSGGVSDAAHGDHTQSSEVTASVADAESASDTNEDHNSHSDTEDTEQGKESESDA